MKLPSSLFSVVFGIVAGASAVALVCDRHYALGVVNFVCGVSVPVYGMLVRKEAFESMRRR